jgi:hypothetical protein
VVKFQLTTFGSLAKFECAISQNHNLVVVAQLLERKSTVLKINPPYV